MTIRKYCLIEYGFRYVDRPSNRPFREGMNQRLTYLMLLLALLVILPVLLYMTLFNLLGIATGLGLILLFGIGFSSLFWLGIVHLFVVSMLYSGASLLFSTFTTSMAAGLLTFILYMIAAVIFRRREILVS